MNCDYNNPTNNSDSVNYLDLLEIRHKKLVAHVPLSFFTSPEKIVEQCQVVSCRKKESICPICGAKAYFKDACGCIAARNLYISMDISIISEKEKIIRKEKRRHKRSIKKFVIESYNTKNELPKMFDGSKIVYIYRYSSKEEMIKEIDKKRHNLKNKSKTMNDLPMQ